MLGGDELSDHYYPFEVYNNIIKMLAYRKLTLVKAATYSGEQRSEPLDKTTFTKLFQYHQYILVTAKDAPDKERRPLKSAAKHTRDSANYPTWTYVLLVMPGATHLGKSANLEKLIKTVGLATPPKDRNIEVLLVHEDEFTSNLVNKLVSYNFNGVLKGNNNNGDPIETLTGYQQIQTVPYYILTTERPKHVLCPPHIPLSKAEEKHVMRTLRVEKSGLPVIRHNEPMGIWYGLTIGSVVKVIVDSETTGTGIKYCVVRPGPSQ